MNYQIQLNNIIQAMQTQASLREAQTSKIMNLVVLPFTVVTVIFVRPYGADAHLSDSAMLMNVT